MKKLFKILIPSAALLMSATFIGLSKPAYGVVLAEGEEETAEPIVEEEKESFIKKSYDTFVVPILSGVSITSIVSAIVCIVTTLIRNHVLDKKMLESDEKHKKQMQEAQEIYNATVLKLEEITNFLANVEEIKQSVLEDKELNAETKEIVKAKLIEMDKLVKESNARIAKLDKLEDAIKLLSQLEIKVAKQSQNLVKSGIVEDLNELSKLMKNI